MNRRLTRDNPDQPWKIDTSTQHDVHHSQSFQAIDIRKEAEIAVRERFTRIGIHDLMEDCVKEVLR